MRAFDVKDTDTSAGVLNLLRSTVGPNNALQLTASRGDVKVVSQEWS